MAKRGPDYLQSLDKRRHDRAAAFMAAGVLLAPAVLAAVGVMVESRSFNPFVVQDRGGHRVRKLRSLRLEAETGPVRTFGTFDHRATTVGRIIRPSGIDESPQVLSVMAGTMSFCGIRDLLDMDKEQWRATDACLFDELEAAKAETGAKLALISDSSLWRKSVVNGTADVVARRSMRMDIEYLQNASLSGDTRLIVRTPYALVSNLIHRQLYETDIALPGEDSAAA